MITQLTPQQEAKFPEYVEKWTAIGLCTEPADRKRAENGVRLAYRAANQDRPRIVWCGSPLSNALTRATIILNGDSVWDSVRASVRASVRDSVRASVRASVWASVRDSVRASVWDSGYGQHDASWIAFYEFFRNECGLYKETECLVGLVEISQGANWFLPHRGLCWISERPHTLRRNSQGRLHCDGGPAVQYPDGWSIWALNGVLVPQTIAETHATKLDPRLILKESNVEIRREIVRKVGIERVCESLDAQILDKRSDYELLNLNLQDGRMRPYLKMKNPSIGVYHIEGVHPNCTTVEQALNFRNGTKQLPSVLT